MPASQAAPSNTPGSAAPSNTPGRAAPSNTPDPAEPSNTPTPAEASNTGSSAAAAPDLNQQSADAPRIATESDGTHIEFHTYGHAEPAVVLIHDWSTDANYWNAQLDPLREHYSTVTLDLAGHGASTRSRSEWSMSAFGGDVTAVISHLSNRQIVLVGHGMGGIVALEAASSMGRRLIGVVLVDALRSAGGTPAPAEIEARVAPFRTDFIGSMRNYVTVALFPKDGDPLFRQKVAYDMSLEPPDVAVASLQALLQTDVQALLRTIHVPVLAINSDLAPTDVAGMRRVLPQFRADVIPHTSHFLMMDAAARFNPVLLKDIDWLRQRAGPPH